MLLKETAVIPESDNPFEYTVYRKIMPYFIYALGIIL